MAAPHRSEAPHRKASPLLTVFLCLGSAIYWLLFTGTFATHELLVGLAVVALSTVFAVVLQRCYPVEVKVRVADALQLWRVPGYVLQDSWNVTAILLRDLAGPRRASSLLRVLRWEHNPSPEGLGRGVLATAGSTSTPNTIVLGIDREQSLMVLHQLHRDPTSTMLRKLGGQP